MGKEKNQEAKPAFNFVIDCRDPAKKAEAQALATRLSVPAFFNGEAVPESVLTLRYDTNGLSLTGEGQSIRGDFTKMLPRLRKNNLFGELLVRASKIKEWGECPTALDATAGLGEDSLLLAAAGFSVSLYEYDPVIAALLADALARAAACPDLCDIVSRMNLYTEDSIKAMLSLSHSPDIILLDPMFPQRQKSALVKKKFQLLHYLEQPCNVEEELLAAALQANPHRIIIKRPHGGAYLAGRKPDYSLEGKAIRYDCIVLPK